MKPMNSGKKSLRDVMESMTCTYQNFSFFKNSSYDLIYINGPRWIPTLLLLNKILPKKTKFIFHIHLKFGKIGHTLVKKISQLPRTQAIICVSNFIAQDYSTLEKIVVISNSLSEEESKLLFKSRDFTKIRIGILGKVCPEKGHDLILETAKNNPDIDFVITEGETLTQYEQSLKKYSSNNITWVPFSQIPYETMEHYHVNTIWMPSQIEESFGLVAIESAARSFLPLVSGRGGLKEIAENIGCPLTLKNLPQTQKTVINIQQNCIKFYRFENFKNKISSLFY
jgi:glycosyltransferase involved in cell wall biosynthesis